MELKHQDIEQRPYIKPELEKHSDLVDVTLEQAYSNCNNSQCTDSKAVPIGPLGP